MASAAGSGTDFGSTLTSTLSSTLTSTRSGEDELDVGVGGFDPAEFGDIYGGGGASGGVEGVFQGHPSVEPKEEGELVLSRHSSFHLDLSHLVL